MGERDDYGNFLSDSLNNTNTNSNSLFSDNQKALTGLTSGNNESVFDQNTVIDLAGQKNLGNNSDFDAFNNPAGNTSQNYVDPGAYSVDASGKYTGLTNLANIKKFIADNKGLFGLAGAAAGAMSPGAKYGKTGYQGAIPQLLATRNMVTAPPTKDYRPGAGGISYGGDVSYTELPVDQKIYSQLSGDSGTSADANLAGKTQIYKENALIPYFQKYPDVAAAYEKNNFGMTPQQFADAHWQKFGQFEERAVPTDKTVSTAIPYFQENPDVALAYANNSMGLTPQQFADLHYATHGTNEERSINTSIPYFQANPDVAKAYAANSMGLTPQQFADVHYAKFGEDEKRATPEDSLITYFQEYPDVLAGYKKDNFGLTPQEFAKAHWKKFGKDEGRIKPFAEGGIAQGRYLRGGTDGMADEIPAKIGKDQPAALSHGEFVIPADVVSHMGNGNSDAGAKKLYSMMDKIRMARTGNKKQGKKINPDKFMPGGLAAAYAAGGAVKKFQTGGSTGTPAANLNAGIAGVESNLSNWAGPYVTNMLGQGQALANMPYQQYMGPLTAGSSDLQTKVASGLNTLSFPGNLGKSFSSSDAYTPSQMTMGQNQPLGTNGNVSTGASTAQPTGIASQYMNPYLQSVLNPQLEELRRQSQINLQPSLAKLTQAGGLGGGRQAIMESEANRNLLTAQNQAIGTGYANAYDKGMQQFNTEQGQSNTLANMMAQQGATQRGIESEGIAADKAQFEEARANPYKMVQFQQSLLQGLPLDAKSYQGIEQSDIVKAAQGATTVNQLLKNLGLIT